MTSTETAPETSPAADDPHPGDRPASPRRRRTNWYGALWRWHFYGAILVVPVLFVLAVSGMTYMFRAQVDAFTHPGVLTVSQPAGATRAALSVQEEVVRAAFPDRPILSVVDHVGDRATVFVMQRSDGESVNVYVDPYREKVTGALTADQLVSDWAERIHGDLLIGTDGVGDRIVELGASWAIVLTVTGFLIFFLGRKTRRTARQKGIRGSRLRGLHAIVGLPVGLGILMLVVSGLPWTGVWGSVAQQVASGGNVSLWGQDPGAESKIDSLIEKTNGTSAEAGWAIGNGPQGESTAVGTRSISIDAATTAARTAGALPPFTVIYPDGEKGVFSVMASQWSDNGNPAESEVSLEKTVHVDQYSGEVVREYSYADYTLPAKIVSQGIAIHEGRRLGPVNTVLSTLFCLAVMFLCVSAPIMWWTRRGTASGMAAPRAALPIWGNGIIIAALILLGIFLPLFGLSVLITLALDQLLIRRIPRLKRFFTSA